MKPQTSVQFSKDLDIHKDLQVSWISFYIPYGVSSGLCDALEMGYTFQQALLF